MFARERVILANGACPICFCTTEPHSGHSIQDYCELCGIGISAHTSSIPSYERDGKDVYFCCERCQSIYIKEIVNNNEYIDLLRKQRDFEILEGYDDLVKNLLIDYINRKYPKDKETDDGGRSHGCRSDM